MNREEINAYLEQQAIRELIDMLLGALFSTPTLWVIGLGVLFWFLRWMLFQGIRAERYREILLKRKEAAEAEALRQEEEERQITAARDAEIAELTAENKFLSVFLFGDSLERRLRVGLIQVKVFEGKERLTNARLEEVELTLEKLSFKIKASKKRTVISFWIFRDLSVFGDIQQKPNGELASSFVFSGNLNKKQLLEKGEIFIENSQEGFSIKFFL